MKGKGNFHIAYDKAMELLQRHSHTSLLISTGENPLMIQIDKSPKNLVLPRILGHLLLLRLQVYR